MKYSATAIFLLVLLFGCTEHVEQPIPEAEYEPVAIVSTYAGSEFGFKDGTALEAKFYKPADIAIAKDGTLYVAENNRVRKISPEGLVTTMAGDTVKGYLDGNGSKARFDILSGIALAENGDLYVADVRNFRVRKIDPKGEVTTVAGDGTNGYQDGKGQQARFGYLVDLEISKEGIIYICDASNHRIRKMTMDGEVTTFAGNGEEGDMDGPKAQANIANPVDLAIADDGTMYIVENGTKNGIFGGIVKKLTIDGMVTTIISEQDELFFFPCGVAILNENALVITDSDNLIKYMTLDESNTRVVHMAGNKASNEFADGTGEEATFFRPSGVAVANDSTIFVADYWNSKIRKIIYK